MEVLVPVLRLSAITVFLFIVSLVLRLVRHACFYIKRTAKVLLGYFFNSLKVEKEKVGGFVVLFWFLFGLFWSL